MDPPASLVWLLLLAAYFPAHHQSLMLPENGTAGLGYSETSCPPRADVFPCSCRDREGVYVRCQSQAGHSSFKDLRPVLKALEGKKRVSISFVSYHVGQMPSEAFRGLDVTKLLFTNGEIDGFESKEGSPAFSGLENSLEELTIQNAISQRGIVDFSLKLGHLRRLRILEVTDNIHGIYFDKKAMTLSNDWFDSGPSSLRAVRFPRNLMQSIGDSVFSKLSNLREINLMRNEIENVGRDMFPETATHLELIDLSYNKLAELPEDIFRDMPSLKYVILMNNELGTLDQRTWEPVWERLEVLKFGTLTCDSSIDWVFDMKRPRQLFATCGSHGDPDKRNERLDKLIDQRQQRGAN